MHPRDFFFPVHQCNAPSLREYLSFFSPKVTFLASRYAKRDMSKGSLHTRPRTLGGPWKVLKIFRKYPELRGRSADTFLGDIGSYLGSTFVRSAISKLFSVLLNILEFSLHARAGPGAVRRDVGPVDPGPD